MARPRKNNADYFSHDNDMRKDTKIESVRAKFRNEGYAIWCMLLETLTEKDNFKIRLSSDLDWELLAGDFRISRELLKDILDYFVKLELISQNDEYIFCQNLDKRFSPLIEKREAFRAKYGVSEEEKGVSDAEKPVSDAEMPQSKVKYSKVKNSKEERSEETSDISYVGVDKEQESYNTKKKTYEKIGLPYKPSPREQKQIDAAEAMKLIDYFKQGAYENHGMAFRLEDKSRRERIQKQARDFYVKVKKNGVEIIDWFLAEYGEWCHYDVDQCFSVKTIERWENRNANQKDMSVIKL